MKRRIIMVSSLLCVLLVGSSLAVFAGGVIGGRFLIHNDPDAVETRASVAYNSLNQEYLVVWEAEFSGPIKEVWGRRVSEAGVPLSSSFRISPVNGGYNPDVTYNGATNQYLIVYETGGSIRGQLVSGAGSLEGAEIAVATGYVHGAYHYHNPTVTYASTSDRYLVVFQYNGDVDSSTRIDARAYLSDGSPEDYAFEVGPLSVTTLPDFPDVTYNRSRDECLVVWQQISAPDDHDIYGRRVRMSGGAGAQGAEFVIAVSTSDEVSPTVAAVPTVPDEGQYLVAWESDQNIMARAVTGMGALSTLSTLADTAWSEHRPAVAGVESAQQFLVLWTWVPVITPPAVMQIQGRTLSMGGVPLHDTVTVGGGTVFDVALAPGLPGNFLIAFDDNEVFSEYNHGIYGLLWGTRVYLPLVLRN